MRFDVKKLIKEVPAVVLGNMCIAVAIAFFVVPNHILVGGSAGVAVILNKITGINENLAVQIITIGMFVIGTLFLGAGFASKTVISAISLPLLLQLFTFIYQHIDPSIFSLDRIIATIFAGVFLGLGIGICYRHNASTGGMDIPPLIINKYTGISAALLVMIVDGLTVLLGALTSGLEAAMYGIVAVWICSFVINKTMTLGSTSAKQVTIVSEKILEVQQAITVELDMGCTIVDAYGGHTNEAKKVILTIIHQKQMPGLMDVIDRIDPNAFVVVADTNEVRGKGFTLDQVQL